MFQDPDLVSPEGFPISESEGFATNKVIVARTFVKTEFGLRPQKDQTPRDEFGHGSRVAGRCSRDGGGLAPGPGERHRSQGLPGQLQGVWSTRN